MKWNMLERDEKGLWKMLQSSWIIGNGIKLFMGIQVLKKTQSVRGREELIELLNVDK